MESISCFNSQFYKNGADSDDDEPQSYISTPEFLESVIARARLLGKRIGVQFAEGFISKKSIGISNLDALLLKET